MGGGWAHGEVFNNFFFPAGWALIEVGANWRLGAS